MKQMELLQNELLIKKKEQLKAKEARLKDNELEFLHSPDEGALVLCYFWTQHI